MGWKRIAFGDDAMARNLPGAVKDAFEAAFQAAGAPGNAALFEHRGDGHVHFYFSPGAARLFEAQLMALGPERAAAPPPEARLTVGRADVWRGT